MWLVWDIKSILYQYILEIALISPKLRTSVSVALLSAFLDLATSGSLMPCALYRCVICVSLGPISLPPK